MALVLLPVFWTPSHSHQVGLYRAHCSACLLAIFSSTILTAGAIAVLLVRDWRAQLDLPARLLVISSPSFLGRAPPPPFSEL
jgi:hypothetical protein